MIILNGKKTKNPKTINKLLKETKIKTKSICIIVNSDIVPKEKWKNFKLKDGDIVEIVGFVGGG